MISWCWWSCNVDSCDEDHADGEEIVVIMGVMRVKSFSRSGRVAGL